MKRMRVGLVVMGLAMTLAAAAIAASLAITRARWDAGDRKLALAGTATAKATVALTNAATGAAIGTARAEDDGNWRLTLERLSAVPCRVRATQGGASVELAVEGAPTNCVGGATKTLASLAIAGPATVAESSTASYAATATFSDGSTQVVTTTASWTENSAFATIAGGVLTTTAVTGNQPVTISASFTSAGVTRSATLAVSIADSPTPPPPQVTGSHAGRFTVYEGTKTCLRCHTSEAVAFHQSVHYQWKGDASESTGLNPGPAGKLGGINDFCIYPDINWLGKLTTSTGKVVDGGCARCHTGLGLKPTPDASTAQLENIDCLLCHSPSYKRTLQLTNGQFAFVPDTANMTVSVLQAAVDIRPTTSGTCLNCHTKAGGGDNFKRGDIEEAHRTATPSLDVHMASQASGGAGLSCTGCHTTVAHRVAGRGVDMRERDLVGVTVACANCHQSTPHSDSTLNRHTARVDCNVCHVPVFAKSAPTDMRRDWSLPGDHNPATGLYEPHMALQTQVTPVYRFFNGQSQFYQFGTPATAGPNGRVLMAGPLGSINDAGAKITALKRHEGRQPIDPITGYLLPLKIGIFFQSGDVATAVTQGIAAMGWTNNGYAFAETERYMGVYHEVAPKEQALGCSSCHGGTRMDFATLGYTPRATRNGKPLCSSCHEPKTASFATIHQKHVTDKRLDCSNCHTFTKAL